jgi:glycosyltransferase involved in cell wall biosynthesis
MNSVSRYVTLLSNSAIELWKELFGADRDVLLVPGAADHSIPPAGVDPFPPDNGTARVLFAGNVYFHDSQPEANVVLIDKLNELGRLLQQSGARLYMIGTGDVTRLDSRHVTWLGHVTHEQAWNFFAHAHVGIVVSAGSFMHNNESTKIYHYLRAGLPVVSEAGFPNDNIVRESGLGVVVENGDMPAMARQIIEASRASWDRAGAVRYILAHHTWDVRAGVYDRLLREQLS